MILWGLDVGPCSSRWLRALVQPPAQREAQAGYTYLCGLALHLGPIWLGKPFQDLKIAPQVIRPLRAPRHANTVAIVLGYLLVIYAAGT